MRTNPFPLPASGQTVRWIDTAIYRQSAERVEEWSDEVSVAVGVSWRVFLLTLIAVRFKV